MKTPEKLNAEKQRQADRALAIVEISEVLETRTRWGKFVARPAQIKAAARKIHDVLAARLRREKQAAA